MRVEIVGGQEATFKLVLFNVNSESLLNNGTNDNDDDNDKSSSETINTGKFSTLIQCKIERKTNTKYACLQLAEPNHKLLVFKAT